MSSSPRTGAILDSCPALMNTGLDIFELGSSVRRLHASASADSEKGADGWNQSDQRTTQSPLCRLRSSAWVVRLNWGRSA